MHGPKDVHLAVEAEENCCFLDEEEETFGEHGFSVDEPQAKTFFLLSGPGVKQGAVIPEMNLVDIAPTLAGLLQLSLPEAEGKSLAEICKE
jgi:predicted AlkP superfamily pyrophosphatase or phosphodiesterase